MEERNDEGEKKQNGKGKGKVCPGEKKQNGIGEGRVCSKSKGLFKKSRVLFFLPQ